MDNELTRTSISHHPWTKEEAVSWFRTHYLKEGHTPNSAYRNRNLGPPAVTLRRLYGDADRAYKDAGVPPPIRKASVPINVRIREIALRDLREQKHLTVACLHCEWVESGDAITVLDLQTRHIGKHGVKKLKKLRAHA